MTNSEQVKRFGYNAYGKPAAALTLLRETVMGPELFDKAFKEYAQRWAFKHPKPADFFRTMEDASAVDLDWFWKGWFYTVDNVDVGIEDVKWFKIREENINIEDRGKKVEAGTLKAGNNVTEFGEEPEQFSIVKTPGQFYGEYQNRIDDAAIAERMQGKNFYQVKLQNKGGLVTPIILEFTFTDGTRAVENIPAEIWRLNEKEVTKVFSFDKEVSEIKFDPEEKTADTNLEDNIFPRKVVPSRFDYFKGSN